MATFTETEYRYMVELALGRLATTGPRGPQNHPVTYRVDGAEGVVDVGGPDLASSRKYRNVRADPRVSLVIDDIAPEAVGPGGQRGRGLEIRGEVEIVALDAPPQDEFSREILRIHPRRIVAWNLDGPGDNSRDVERADAARY